MEYVITYNVRPGVTYWWVTSIKNFVSSPRRVSYFDTLRDAQLEKAHAIAAVETPSKVSILKLGKG